MALFESRRSSDQHIERPVSWRDDAEVRTSAYAYLW